MLYKLDMEFEIIHSLQTRMVKNQYWVIVIFIQLVVLQFYDDVEVMFNGNYASVFWILIIS